MNIRNRRTVRKTVRTASPTRHAEPSIYAVRYILDRYDVSPSLARTIACLAMLGGR